MNNNQQEGRLRALAFDFVKKLSSEKEIYFTEYNLVTWLCDFYTSLPPSPLTEDELKAKFAEYLGEKELNTTDAYAVEWTLKNR